MITLEQQYITSEGGKSKLNFEFSIDGQKSHLWFEVDNEYEQYLCTERSDAFLIGVLPYALKNGHDIVSSIPVTEELLLKLREDLIPILVKNDKHCLNIKLEIPSTAKIIKNAGAVGTGVSGGIDSFHAILCNHKSVYKDSNITHLCIFNVGSFGGNQKYRGDIRDLVIERGQKIANELELPLIVSDSNLANIFPRNHEYTHTYSSMFAVYCLQKLWKTYFYGSGNPDINDFSTVNALKNFTTDYEVLLFYCFNNRNLHIFSEGMALDRLEKTAIVAESPIAQKNLHVCTDEKFNCSRCPKCMRTILSLDAIDKLEEFSQVFDIEYYKKNKSKFYWFLFNRHYRKDLMMESIYKAMKHKIPLFKTLYYKTGTHLKHFIYDVTYPERKTCIKIRILGLSFKFKKH